MIINIEDRSTVDRNPYDGTMDDRGVTAFLATLGRVSGIFLVYGCGDLYEPARAGSPFSIKESFG